MRQRVNEGSKVLGAVKGVVKCRGVGMNVKRVLYERVVVPTVMYGSELWAMRETDRRAVTLMKVQEIIRLEIILFLSF